MRPVGIDDISLSAKYINTYRYKRIAKEIHKALKKTNVVYMSGPAGIGKTSFIREFYEELSAKYLYTTIVDLRELSTRSEDNNNSINQIIKENRIIIFDNFDRPNDSLAYSFIDEADEGTKFLIAGRTDHFKRPCAHIAFERFGFFDSWKIAKERLLSESTFFRILAINRVATGSPLLINILCILILWEYYDSLKNIKRTLQKNTEDNCYLAIDEYMSCIAEREWVQSDFVKARRLYLLILKFREHILSAYNPIQICSYNNYAKAEKLLGQYNKAIDLYSKALDINEKTSELSCFAKDYVRCIVLNNIACTYQEKRESNIALEYFRKAEALAFTIADQETSRTKVIQSIILNNIACVNIDIGKIKEALSMLFQVQEIQQEDISKHDYVDSEFRYIEITNSNLAEGLFVDREYDQSFDLYTKCLTVLERDKEKNRLLLDATYNNIGEIFKAKKDYIQAEEFYSKSINSSRDVFGEYHPTTAITYNNIADLYCEMGKFDDAVKYYLKSYLILAMHPDNEKVSIAVSGNLQECYKKVRKTGRGFDKWLKDMLKKEEKEEISMCTRQENADELREEVKGMTEEECEKTFGLSKEEMNNKIANDEHSQK